MRACVMVEPQMGMTYDQLLHVAKLARECGFEGIFRSDHYERARSGAPVLDAWATLAGLVRDLDGGVVGTLVSPVTFRHPGQLGKVVSTVAHMSRGPRVELGLGTGWNEREHKQFGFEFGTFGDRFKILEEYLPIVRGILKGEPFDHRGTRYSLDGCTNTPAAPDVRIIVGGAGPRRTPRLAARFGDELNMVMLPPDRVAERIATCRAAAKGDISFSWMGQFLVARDAEALEKRANRLAQAFGTTGDRLLGSLKGRIPVGTIEEGADFLRTLRDIGIDRVMLQHLAIDDDDHLRAAAEMADLA